jgi:two-component system, LuxR family, sensor kinase FixL
MFGYRAEEMIGEPILRLLPPDRIEEEAMILDRLRSGERFRQFETVRVRKDGSEIAVVLTISPILDEAGTIVGVSKIARDITAERRTQARIQELQAELAHVARVFAMGQMASALAHELNQPLAAVGNYTGALARLLAKRTGELDPARDIVERIRLQVSRAGAVLRRLREHIAKRTPQRVADDINRVVGEAVELGLVGTLHLGILTSVMLDPEIGPATFDRIQIGQVVVNLVRNAVDAMASGTRRELAVSTRALAGVVEIAVADTGSGIPPEVAARLFQPFVTSKATGLGLGLSICRELVEAHGGQLSVSSVATGGTRFVVRLPTVTE